MRSTANLITNRDQTLFHTLTSAANFLHRGFHFMKLRLLTAALFFACTLTHAAEPKIPKALEQQVGHLVALSESWPILTKQGGGPQTERREDRRTGETGETVVETTGRRATERRATRGEKKTRRADKTTHTESQIDYTRQKRHGC